MKRYIMCLIGIIFLGCTNNDPESDSALCEEDDSRCVKNTVLKCVQGKWVIFNECLAGTRCAYQDGAPECVDIANNDTGTVADTTSEEIVDTDSDADTDTDSDADTDTDSDADTDADSDTDTDADSDADTDTDSDADTDTDSDAGTVTDSGSDTVTNSDANTDRDSSVDTEESELPVSTMVVGGWGGKWECEQYTGEIYWILCPNGRIRGTRVMDSLEETTYHFEQLLEGNYYVDDSTVEVSFDMIITTVIPSEIAGDTSLFDGFFEYSYAYDALGMHNHCGFWMVRIPGGEYDAIYNSDCE